MEQYVERYRTPTRVLHWFIASSFTVLFLTGLTLFIPQLGVLAQDSWTRLLHRIAAAIFVIAPVIYMLFNWKATLKGIKEAFDWSADDIGWLKAAPRYYFLCDEDVMPPQGHMNTGQKMWWFMALVFGAIFVISGLIMWFFKDLAPAGLLQWMVFVHDVAFIAMGTMFFVHLYLSVAHPLMRPLRVGAWSSMARGKISAEYARAHHAKWYEEIARAKVSPKEAARDKAVASK